MATYRGRSARLEQLEKRSTSYRFDLETAPCWDRVEEPGFHAPPQLLADFGVDVERLGAGIETFDWIYGATVCRTFELLETTVITFLHEETSRLVPSKSVEALIVEEEKHVALFRRYADALLARHDRALFERLYAPSQARMAQRLGAVLPDDVQRHYLFWTKTLFFEEFTLYLDERLQDLTDVQPTWRSIHRLHRIEEVQHVATDEAYLELLTADAAQRRPLSQSFLFSVLTDFPDTVGLTTALAWARESGFGELCPEGQVTKRPFIRHVLERPAFRRTRAAAPALSDLAKASPRATRHGEGG